MKRGLSGAIIIALMMLAVLVISAMVYFNYKSPEIKRLETVEVRDYNGTKLDSISSFRENSIKGVQHIKISNYTLKISGLVSNPKSYTYEEIIERENYEKIVTLHCVEGWSTKILWKGILIKDLFDEAKPLPAAKAIIFHAYDGYTVTYPVDYFTADKNILLAYMMNNVTIPDERGFPFVLVAEDKWGYKWIKWITEIEFTDDTNFKGYWESKGYSKEGNLNESFVA